MLLSKLKRTQLFIIHVYREWVLDRTVRLGAGIAYYMLIALVPIVILAVGIAGTIFTVDEINQYLVETLAGTFGGSVQAVDAAFDGLFTEIEITNNLRNIGIIGICGAIVTISFLVVALQDAMNVIWNRPVVKGIRSSVLRYVAAYGVVLILGSLLLVSLLIHSLTAFAVAIIPSSLNIIEELARLAGSLASFALLVGFIGLLTKIMLKVPVGIKQILIGSTLTAIMLQIGTFLLGLYFSSTAGSTVAGVFGGVLLALGWMYYIAQILLIGNQATKVLSYKAGNAYLQKHLQRSDPLLDKQQNK